jgi:hypothetical protein
MQEKFDSIEELGGNISLSMQAYCGEIYGLDLQVGRLLNELDELGLSNNTVVVFSSDNGPARGDATKYLNMTGWAGGYRGGKHRNYEGGLGVPFIVRWPNHVSSGVVNHKSVFSALDWLPTICSLANVSVPEELIEGEDVSDIWLEKNSSNRSRTNPILYRGMPGFGSITMLYDRWKLFENDKELYDLEVDLEERENVYEQNPDIVEDMVERLREWESTLPTVHARLPDDPFPFDPTAPAIVIGPPKFALSANGYPPNATAIAPVTTIATGLPTTPADKPPAEAPTPAPAAMHDDKPTVAPMANPSAMQPNEPSGFPTASPSFLPSTPKTPSPLPISADELSAATTPTCFLFCCLQAAICFMLLSL